MNMFDETSDIVAALTRSIDEAAGFCRALGLEIERAAEDARKIRSVFEDE